MNRNTKLGLSALAVIVGLGGGAAFVGPSLAQGAGGPPTAGMRGHGPQMAQHHGPRHDSFGRIDGRLAFLKAELKITPAQEPLWGAYEKVIRDNAGVMKARFETMRAEREKARETAKAQGKDRPEIKRLGAVERMERMQAIGKERLDRQAKVLEALKPLYASFSDDQKKTADELLARGGHGPSRHGHGRFGRH